MAFTPMVDVGLNVNNPHFLIMQGKITKVLNAKPPEILGMLEEAAGTRMYESKKEAALRTLARKQVKVDEIDRLLADEVEPALERLRRERGEYVAWQEALDRLDALRRFCAAHRWWLGTNGQKEAEAALLTARQRASELESEAAEKEAEAGAAAVELSELEAAAGGEGPALAAAANAPTPGRGVSLSHFYSIYTKICQTPACQWRQRLRQCNNLYSAKYLFRNAAPPVAQPAPGPPARPAPSPPPPPA